MYVADGGDYLSGRTADARSQIVVLDQQGTILERFGSFGTKPGQLRIAHDLAVADDGTIYVTELMNKRLQQFRILTDYTTHRFYSTRPLAASLMAGGRV